MRHKVRHKIFPSDDYRAGTVEEDGIAGTNLAHRVGALGHGGGRQSYELALQRDDEEVGILNTYTFAGALFLDSVRILQAAILKPLSLPERSVADVSVHRLQHHQLCIATLMAFVSAEKLSDSTAGRTAISVTLGLLVRYIL